MWNTILAKAIYEVLIYTSSLCCCPNLCTIISSLRINSHDQKLVSGLKFPSQFTPFVPCEFTLPLWILSLLYPLKILWFIVCGRLWKGEFLLLSQVHPAVSSWKHRLSQASPALTWLRPQHMSPRAALQPCAGAVSTVMDLARLGGWWRDIVASIRGKNNSRKDDSGDKLTKERSASKPECCVFTGEMLLTLWSKGEQKCCCCWNMLSVHSNHYIWCP